MADAVTGQARRRRAAPEKRVQRDIIRALRSLGFTVHDLTQPRRTMLPLGLPDLYVSHVRWKIRLWIEVKAPGGKCTTEQLVWHRYEREAGGVVIVAHSVGEVIDGIIEAWPEMATVWRR